MILPKIQKVFKEHPKLEQFSKYVLIGGVLFVTEWLLFVLLTLVISIAVTNFIAMAVGATVGFLLNGRFAFQNSSNIWRSAALYIVLFFINLAFSTLAIWFLMDTFSISKNIAKFLTMPCIVMWNFILYRKVVFV